MSLALEVLVRSAVVARLPRAAGLPLLLLYSRLQPHVVDGLKSGVDLRASRRISLGAPDCSVQP